MDKKEMLDLLETTKTGLETKAKEVATQAAKDQVALDLKAVEDKITEVKSLIPETMKGFDFAKVVADIKALTDQGEELEIKFKQTGNQPVKVKTFEDNIKEAVEAKHDDIQKFARKEIKSVNLEIKAVADQSTANITGGSVWGAVYKPGIIMNPNTQVQMRDLIPTSPAGPGTDYYFMKESGAGEGSPAWTSEKQATAATTQATGLKPQIDLDLVEASVKFETLAAFMVVSNKSLLNIPNFISFLQRRLPVKLMDVESTGILYGTGTSPEIKGILTAGNFTASTSSATILVEKIIDDMSLLEDTYKRMATGIVLRPADYYSFFKNKAGGSGEYDLPQGVTFVNGTLYILGVPVAKTTALNAADYIVGDFRNGTELLIQESINVRFFEQDGTNVRTNQTTVRIEETVALPVFGSDYFIKGATGN